MNANAKRLRKELGANLRAARRARELSRQAAAERVGVSLSTMVRWEGEVGPGPGVVELYRLAAVYGVGVGELMPRGKA